MGLNGVTLLTVVRTNYSTTAENSDQQKDSPQIPPVTSQTRGSQPGTDGQAWRLQLGEGAGDDQQSGGQTPGMMLNTLHRHRRAPTTKSYSVKNVSA